MCVGNDTHVSRCSICVEIYENIENISTENTRQNKVIRAKYADIVRNQPNTKDNQLSRMRRAHGSLNVLNI